MGSRALSCLRKAVTVRDCALSPPESGRGSPRTTRAGACSSMRSQSSSKPRSVTDALHDAERDGDGAGRVARRRRPCARCRSRAPARACSRPEQLAHLRDGGLDGRRRSRPQSAPPPRASVGLPPPLPSTSGSMTLMRSSARTPLPTAASPTETTMTARPSAYSRASRRRRGRVREPRRPVRAARRASRSAATPATVSTPATSARRPGARRA